MSPSFLPFFSPKYFCFQFCFRLVRSLLILFFYIFPLLLLCRVTFSHLFFVAPLPYMTSTVGLDASCFIVDPFFFFVSPFFFLRFSDQVFLFPILFLFGSFYSYLFCRHFFSSLVVSRTFPSPTLYP